MDSIDSSDAKLPAPFPTALSPALVSGPPRHQELAPAPQPQVNPHVILRGLIRHWWRIILIWLILFAPAAWLIHIYVEPTYEAFSLLKVEPAQPSLFGPPGVTEVSRSGAEPYLQTQATLITSENVLREAVADPRVVDLPTIKQSIDAMSDLRKHLLAEIIPDTYLIRVALESSKPNEAATIVTAVVDSYLRDYAASSQGANKELKKSLHNELEKLAELIEKKKVEVNELAAKGTLDIKKASSSINIVKSEKSRAAENEEGVSQATTSELTQGQHDQVLAECYKTQFDLIETESLLEARRAAIKEGAEQDEQLSQDTVEELEASIKEEFLKDSDVVALLNEMSEADEQLERAKGVARQGADRGRRTLEKRKSNLEDQYATLWNTKYKEIRRRLRGAAKGASALQSISDLEFKVALLKKSYENKKKVLDEVKVEKKKTNNDTFLFTFLTHELTSLLNREEQVNKNLAQVEFQTNQEQYRVTPQHRATVPKVPSNDKRLKYMAAAGGGIFFMSLGLFLLLEVKAERVADPDDLSTRIRSEVYALPPLPTARSMRKLKAPESDDHVEQFIQRLDHVRFAVCSSFAEAGKGRCVLITSAIGGEGKTTLAAQLAARCGNAGMSTLLIDADLRRAALCALLDVPEGPGLSDVLKDEATIEEAVIRVQGGTFNLLPAGTPIQDTSRVLQARNLGLLISQLRQLYDLVIIDSPPVLPVPDALILGRWADGAVLAARYDISRFPQVERARRQLDNAGVAVLGTVINGMRHASSYYGRYSYSRRKSPQADSSSTI